MGKKFKEDAFLENFLRGNIQESLVGGDCLMSLA